MDEKVIASYMALMKSQGHEAQALAWLSDKNIHERYLRCTSKPHYWNFHTGERQCSMIDVPGQVRGLFFGVAFRRFFAADSSVAATV